MEFIDFYCSFQHVLWLVCFPQVEQKQTLGEVETKTFCFIASYNRNISAKKLLKSANPYSSFYR